MFFEYLLFGFFVNDGLEGVDNGGEGVGIDGRFNDVMGVFEVDDLRVESFVDGVVEGVIVSFDGNDFGVEKFYVEYIKSLVVNIFSVYENGVFYVEFSIDGSCGYIVLVGIGFGNNFGFV